MDYIFKRFGKDHVALCGSYSTFKHDAVIHELGKVFGLPQEERTHQIDLAVADHQMYSDYNRATLKFLNTQCL